MKPSEHLRTVKRNIISMPQNDILLANKLAKFTESFEQKYMRVPTTSELADMTGEEEKKVKAVLPSLSGFATCYGDVESFCIGDSCYSAERHISAEDRNREIGRVLDTYLTKRCAYIVRSVFGIGGSIEKDFRRFG